MRKALLLAVVMIGLASFAGAVTLSFSEGAAFVQPARTDYTLAVGNASQIMWYADDLGYGIKNETTYLATNMGPSITQTINEIVIQKFLSKSVAIGLGFGSAVEGITVCSCVEINGAIQILSGKGEKVSASLDFGIAARWIPLPVNDFNQTVSTLAVNIGL